MKTLLTSTALMLALAGGTMAQSVQTEVGIVKMSEASLLVSEMMGEPVYNFRGRPNTDAPMPLDGANRFERIASIKDVVINSDGTVEAIVMSVGGLWGLADREVSAAMEGLTVVTDVRGDRYFVIFTDEETLDSAPRFNKFDIGSAAIGFSTDGSYMVAEAHTAEPVLPMGQDEDASIRKAKPVGDMVGAAAPNGTDIDVRDTDATVDGVPRDAANGMVNTDREEAEVGIPDEEN